MNIASQEVRDSSVSYLTSPAEGYERWAPIYDHAPNPLLAREERYVLPLLGDLRRKWILDLACGTGRWLDKLVSHGSEFSVGIDCSSAMLSVAGQKPGIAGRLSCAACESLPFGNEVFDLAICSFALGHIHNLDTLAREVARVVKPGGDLFITDLHPDAYRFGWRVGFKDHEASVQIEVLARELEDVILPFSSNGFQYVSQASLWLEEPEKAIFARARKLSQFSTACQVPAVIAVRFRRSGSPVEFWETS